MKKSIVIVANGNIQEGFDADKIIPGDRFVIAVDGGLRNAEKIRLKPDEVVGDLDSLSEGKIEELESDGINTVVFPKEKDQNDLELALLRAADMDPEEIVILGALGKRFDHTLFNVMLLFHPSCRSCPVRIVDGFEVIIRADNPTVLEEPEGTVVSLMPVTEKVTGITLEGFYYPLEKETLVIGSSHGLSNVITSPPGIIRFSKGRLLVIINREEDVD